MGSTAKGLRYPEPTDRLNQVAQFIEDLAEDVDAELTPYPLGVKLVRWGAATGFTQSAINVFGTGASSSFTAENGRAYLLRAVVNFGRDANDDGTSVLQLNRTVAGVTTTLVSASSQAHSGLLVAEQVLNGNGTVWQLAGALLRGNGSSSIAVLGGGLAGAAQLTVLDIGPSVS